MWKNRGLKRKAEGDSTTEDDSRGNKTAASGSTDGDGFVCELSKNRRVSVREFGGKTLVDIREYYSSDGKLLPGKKGISLSLDQWNILKEHIEQIDKAVTENA